jgi:hypothetical protein
VAASRSLAASRTAGSRIGRRLLTLGLGVFLILSELILWQRAHLSVSLECRAGCQGRISAHPEWFVQANAVLLGICLVVLGAILAVRWRRRVA